MNIDFQKSNGLVPAVVVDNTTNAVLMLGYMNKEALEVTEQTGRVTFYSRSKQRLWTKGESSGNFLELVSVAVDCDADTLLIRAEPKGPTCHTGQDTCFGNFNSTGFLYRLESIIDERGSADPESSYTARLLSRGINKVAQKVGEEAVEVVIEAKDANRELFLNESADLLYHLLVLLKAKNVRLSEIEAILHARHKN